MNSLLKMFIVTSFAFQAFAASAAPTRVRDVAFEFRNVSIYGATIIGHKPDIARLFSKGPLRIICNHGCDDLLAPNVDGPPPSIARKIEDLPANNPWANLPNGRILIRVGDRKQYASLAGAIFNHAPAVGGGDFANSGSGSSGGNGSGGKKALDPPPWRNHPKGECSDGECCLESEACINNASDHSTSMTISCGSLSVTFTSDGKFSVGFSFD